LKTLYRKRTVIWPFYFYTIIRTLSKKNIKSSIEIVLLFYHNCNITILVSNSDKLSSHIL
ncbi:hypothetical protein DDL35_10575, partial [Staphylococcus aureus]